MTKTFKAMRRLSKLRDAAMDREADALHRLAEALAELRDLAEALEAKARDNDTIRAELRRCFTDMVGAKIAADELGNRCTELSRRLAEIEEDLGEAWSGLDEVGFALVGDESLCDEIVKYLSDEDRDRLVANITLAVKGDNER